MGCTGSKADAARTEWEELVGKNAVAKVIDEQWKSFNSGTRGDTIQWATDAEGAVSSQSVAEIEAHFRKFVDFEASEKGSTVDLFQFENGVGAPNTADAEAAEEEFEAEAAAVEETKKKAEDAAATEEEKKEGEVEAKKEELEKKIEAGEKTPEAFRAFLENGVWAHKPAAMKAGETGGRTFGGGWKRRYFALAKGEDVMDYGEGPAKPSKGTIAFKEITAIELLSADQAKQVKAPAKFANFCFVIKTAALRYNFSCETAEDANLVVEAIRKLAAIPKEGEAVAEKVVCEDGLLKVSVSLKPKEGKNKTFYHQLQYHLAKEEVKVEGEKKEEEKKEEETKAEEEKKE